MPQVELVQGDRLDLAGRVIVYGGISGEKTTEYLARFGTLHAQDVRNRRYRSIQWRGEGANVPVDALPTKKAGPFILFEGKLEYHPRQTRWTKEDIVCIETDAKDLSKRIHNVSRDYGFEYALQQKYRAAGFESFIPASFATGEEIVGVLRDYFMSKILETIDGHPHGWDQHFWNDISQYNFIAGEVFWREIQSLSPVLSNIRDEDDRRTLVSLSTDKLLAVVNEEFERAAVLKEEKKQLIEKYVR